MSASSPTVLTSRRYVIVGGPHMPMKVRANAICALEGD